MFKSIDAGQSWNASYSSSSPLNCIRQVDENILYAMGNNVAIIKTMNAGNTWSVETINTTEQRSFTHIKDGKAIITGSNGTLFTNPNIAVGIEKNKQNIKPMTLLPNPIEGILYIHPMGSKTK